MSYSRRIGTLLLAVAGFAGAASCENRKPTEFVHLVVFLDRSVSAEDQVARWVKVGEKECRALGPGAAVSVYTVKGHTLDSAPLFNARSEPVCLECGADTFVAQKRKFLALRNGFARALASAASGPPARATDLIGMLDRLGRISQVRQPGESIHAIVFSDFLNSVQGELDMEKRLPTPRQTREIIDRLAATHGWTGQTLAGIKIMGYLPVDPKRPMTAQQRRDLEAFWRSLIGALGGELTRFDI